MTTSDLFKTTAHENIRVNFFNDSYMFAEPKFYTIDKVEDLIDIKRFSFNYLMYCKSKSIKDNSGSYWATISVESEGRYKEIFSERIKL